MGASFIVLSPLQISVDPPVILCLPRNTPSTRKSIVHLFESFTKVPLWKWQLFVTGAYFEMGGWV